MRILHVTRDLPPRTRGGISTAVHLLAERDRADGHEVSVVSFDGWRKGTGAGVARPEGEVCRLTGESGLEAAQAWAIERKPDRVVVHSAMLWDFGIRVRDASGARLELFVHVVQVALRERRGLDRPTQSELAQRRALQEADRVLVPGEAARELLAGHHLEAAERATLASIPMPHASVTNPVREPWRVLHVGRFDVLKGTADVLAMLERLPDHTLVIAGGLPDNPKSERRWLRRWRESVSPDVAARLEFLGWLSPEALSSQYSRAHVVVAPSHLETFGLAVLEAQEHDCPLVLTDIPAHLERLDRRKPHRLVPVARPEALAQAVRELSG